MAGTAWAEQAVRRRLSVASTGPVTRGCPCPLAGRERRPARPSFTARQFRFAIQASLASVARSRAWAPPRHFLQSFPRKPGAEATGRATHQRPRHQPPHDAAAANRKNLGFFRFAQVDKGHGGQWSSARDVLPQMTGIFGAVFERGTPTSSVGRGARALSPDTRCGPPGLRSFEAACAPPSMAPLASYAGSQGTGNPPGISSRDQI